MKWFVIVFTVALMATAHNVHAACMDTPVSQCTTAKGEPGMAG